jgi:dTDP-4-amino-4,6-dideoxygalactose transaminase
MTFCSSANVVLHLGARPILVDVGEDFNVEATAIARAITPRTKVIMPVHFAGRPCAMDAILEVANTHGLPVVEDAAHALGAEYRDRRIGTFGRMTVFSFYASKNITTGEGGMVTTDSASLAERLRRLTLHGMSLDAWKRYASAGSWYYEVAEPGYKYNMMDLQAALGIHQLKKIDAFLRRRELLAERYDRALGDVPELQIPANGPHRKTAWHLYVIQLKLERLRADRSRVIAELAEANIGCSVHFIPVHLHPLYRRLGYSELPRSESLYSRTISLPLYPGMSEQDADDVIAAIQQVIHRWAA